MNLLDWVLIGITAVSMVTAAIQGFVYEVWMMAATLAAVGVAVWEHPRLEPWLGMIHDPATRSLAAFFLLLGAALLLAMVVGRVIRGMVNAVGLKAVDRLLGAGLGLARGVVLAAAVVFVLTVYPVRPQWLAGSMLAPRLLWGAQALAALAPAGLASRFENRVRSEVRLGLDGVREQWQ